MSQRFSTPPTQARTSIWFFVLPLPLISTTMSNFHCHFDSASLSHLAHFLELYNKNCYIAGVVLATACLFIG